MNASIEALNLWGNRFVGFAGPMLVQSSLFIVLMLAVDRALQQVKAQATIRYAFWMLVLVKLCLPVTLTLPTSPVYWISDQRFMNGTTSAGNGLMIQNKLNFKLAKPGGVAPRNSVDSQPRRSVLTWHGFLFAGWLTGLSCLVTWTCWRGRLIVNLLSKTTAAKAELEKMLESCQQQLGVAPVVSIRLTSDICSPAICCLSKPVILMPVALTEALAESEMRSVLLHELAHYRRRDLWIGQLQIALQLFYWYNPVLWLANAAIRRVREQAVDEVVQVEMKDEADVYSETLLRVAKLAVARAVFSIGLLGILESASGLKERIQLILRLPRPRRTRIGLGWGVVVALTAVVLLPMAGGSKDATPVSSQPADRSPVALKSPDKRNDDSDFMDEQTDKGSRLNVVQAQELEKKVKANPEDISARSQLLGYYTRKQAASAEARKARQEHILWLIAHYPETNIRGPYVDLVPPLDGAAYEQGKTLWLNQIQKNPQNLIILDHAADFLLLWDEKKAEELWTKAQGLEISNPYWSERLAHLYALDATSASPVDKNSPGKALSQLERAQANTKDESFNLLDDLAKMAFTAGKIEKARRYANDLLSQASEHKKDWNYGNAIHDGNMILGRIAVREGKLDEARKYLLEAGKTPGSPQLNSFGPNMSLANDLIQKGEKETVLAYFKQCGVFWRMGGKKLEEWTGEVTAGRTLDFGGNLAY